MEELSVLKTISQTLFDKKAFNILTLDMRKVSSLTDFCVIAEGNVDRHLVALKNAIEDALEDFSIHPTHVEGLKGGGWVVLDYGFVIIHLMSEEQREVYCLEELWKEAKVVNIPISITENNK